MDNKISGVDLNRIDFGASAAEREITKGLVEYFVESEAFHNVLSGKKSIVLGNRGSGKSAIFKVLGEREKMQNTLVIELSPEDYSYEMLSSVLAKEHCGSWAKQGAFAAAWKYLIYVLVMKKLIKEPPILKTGSAAKIYAYLRDCHSGTQENPISLLISYLKRIECLKIGSYEVALKTKELSKLYRLDEISDLLPDVTQLCSRKRLLVLVDELDRGWDASEDARAFVAGLFQAAVSINQISPDLRVLISLRKELYDNIPSLYEDAQKVRDIIEVITWDEPALLHLIANRIRYSIPELKREKDEACWGKIFSSVLDYRQTKSFNYLIDRTLYRPREIIQFCNISLEECKKAGKHLIDYSVISKAELSYSEERTKDISAEYRFQYPGLMSIFEIFRGKTYTISRADLEALCLGIAIGEFKVARDAAWAVDQDPELIIDVLWRIGFLRAQAVGGIKAMRRSGSSYLGPHQVSNLHLRNVQRFHVHPMFRSYLGMKEGKDQPID